MKHPKVSIITPSYNQGRYLEHTIQSVINQSYKNIEYIVIDGGSTDESTEIIQKYHNYFSYCVSEPDRGQADAINKGIAKSTGDFLYWLNSDDLILSDFIQNRMNFFELHPDAKFVYGDVYQGHSMLNKSILNGRPTSYFEMLRTLRVPIPQQSAIWKREVTESIGLLDIRWHVLLDREYFMRIARKFSLYYVPGPEAFFRIHKDSKSSTERMSWIRELPEYYEQLFTNELVPEARKKLMDQCLVNVYLTCSRLAAREKRIDLFLHFMKKAFQQSPVFFVNNNLYFLITAIMRRLSRQKRIQESNRIDL